VTDGRLDIRKDGNFRKFVAKVGQISFNGRRARDQGQDVTFVCERAVLRLEREGLVLTEIAPGVDLERDVLARMELRPHVAPGLKPMDPRLFREGPMGLVLAPQARRYV
jgi:propionate CoA-transferase